MTWFNGERNGYQDCCPCNGKMEYIFYFDFLTPCYGKFHVHYPLWGTSVGDRIPVISRPCCDCLQSYLAPQSVSPLPSRAIVLEVKRSWPPHLPLKSFVKETSWKRTSLSKLLKWVETKTDLINQSNYLENDMASNKKFLHVSRASSINIEIFTIMSNIGSSQIVT